MLSARMPDLPVRAVLPAVTGALQRAGSAVLVAPPGTGKTTLVPLALAGAGRVVVAEPRRVAARAAARRMADLLGEQVGDTVGYTVRGERRVGPRTRVEVVTTGVLVRRLQRDPELPGTDVVLLDECHERHLDTDLALAFTVDVRATLRPDLRLLATSATADARRLSAVLGPDRPAPVVVAESALFPVDVVWAPPGPVDPPHGLRVDPRLLDHVAATVRVALRDDTGDVLVFLPGAGEIAAVAGRLGDLRGDVDVIALHGRQSGREQDAALRAAARRRVILATAVSESSLTVPGVRVVVDAGLARVPRTDHARGLGALVTVPASRAAATQRAGRAGREAPGRVYRCWPAATHERLPAHAEPEVAVADLTGFALQLACWGAPDGTGLALPDPPPEGALRVATATLAALGAVDADGRVTPRGRSIAATGTHPRLARALLDGAGTIGARRAAEVVALLSDEGPAGSGDDLVTAWRRLRTGADQAATARWRTEVRRLTTALGSGTPDPDHPAPDTPVTDDLAAGLLVGLAYPERLARLRPGATTTYLMAGGTAADLPPGSGLAGTPWLAIAVADRSPGRGGARIRLAAAIDEATAREAGAAQLSREREVGWVDGDVVARDVERLGAIVLADRPIARPDPAAVGAALRGGLERAGLTLLTWTPAARALRERLAFCRLALGEPWPAVDDAALLDRVDAWLGPELAGAVRRADLARIDVAAALRRLVPWPQAARLDEVAPERLAVPSGSRVRVDYTDPAAPVLAVKLQETFGWADAPRLADGRVAVLLHLLSPAGRPVAVTRDLASFWRTGYRQVRAELRGRYPRHPWPEDPTTAEPTGRTRPRRG
ncbi:ATP-dependent helicase HrpB [Polymorphospora sp. NPDC050346]|uniref:ATP-dependent helicase HrpB n=1 Tax=Polymorphospora sp. NPDC050346 TaxID=3155780 RepID=UPI0033E5833E